MIAPSNSTVDAVTQGSLQPQPRAPFDRNEPIPGYLTTELIGRGGYGEVWKATAPGGLTKAVKIVYGNLDPKLADRELRSLSRIKEVRYPLLLSIERIEIVDGNLVIVTDLADCSLKDHFQACREKGLPGIPRDDLLDYLRDAADALDFIYENYSLQHLDVKPENLLLVGNRAKVADFGLIKNIYERSASLVEGLTPFYAPPELFEGRPDRHSDQYGLAIVYQQMLTGELPFNGASAAQLATQHLREAPELQCLHRADRPVIARALAKAPNQRFDSCRAMIDALAAADTNSSPEEDSSAGYDSETPACVTEALPAAGIILGKGSRSAKSEATAGSDASSRQGATAGVAVDANSSRETKADDCSAVGPVDADDRGYAPTVYIGIGGTAAVVLQKLRHKLNDHVGKLSECPSLKMLLIDTDVKPINALATDSNALQEIETLAVPLRKAEDYRARESGLFRWLSRRWFYNIPRNLSTDGFRPLGRLALVDHAQRIMSSLRNVISRACAPENEQQGVEEVGLSFRSGSPRVVIVASISGGTGGGMVLDVAYAVRTELKKHGFSDEDVHGVLLHSTPAGNKGRDKAIANAFATLQELNHYSRPGNYFPGEPAARVPSFHGNNRTFASTYVVDLGEGLGRDQWETAADQVAAYLYCSTVTPAKGFFDACRQADEAAGASGNAKPTLRSFDVCQLGGSGSGSVTDVTRRTCLDLVMSWQQGRFAQPSKSRSLPSGSTPIVDKHAHLNSARFLEIEQLAKQKIEEFGLQFESLRKNAFAAIAQEVGRDVDSYVEHVIHEAIAPATRTAESTSAEIDATLALIDGVFDTEQDRDEAHETEMSLYDLLVERLSVRANKLANMLLSWVHELVDDVDWRATGARHAAESLKILLHDAQGAVANHVARTRETAATLKLAIKSGVFTQCDLLPSGRWRRRESEQEKRHQALIGYARSRIEETTLRVVNKQIRVIESRITTLMTRLDYLLRDLNVLADDFRSEACSATVGDSDSAETASPVLKHDRIVFDLLIDRSDELVRELERTIDTHVLVGDRKLQRFLEDSTNLKQTLVQPLREFARVAVLRYLGEINRRLIEGPIGLAQLDHDANLGMLFAKALPPKSNVANDGTERLLMVIPESADQTSIHEGQQRGHNGLTVVRGRTSGITLCRETGSLRLERLANRIVHGHEVYRQLADRLHTRIDVNWAPIDTPSTEAPDPAGDIPPSRRASDPVSVAQPAREDERPGETLPVATQQLPQ